MNKLGFYQAFEDFMSKDFENACISSTHASWGGSYYAVELFEDGHYRILWENQIGNRYDAKTIIMKIPAMDSDEYDSDNEIAITDNCEDELSLRFEELMDTLL